MRIAIPSPSLVALVGASGSGKSTFAKKHFKPTEVLSSDFFRALVSDDENNQQATPAAFDSLFYIAHKRLDGRKLTVIDATNVQFHARAEILALAKTQHLFAVAIVFDMSEALCIERNQQRPRRRVAAPVIRRQLQDLASRFHTLTKEGFRYVYVLKGPEAVESAEIVRVKLPNNRTADPGPFDIIGDIHGCYDELCALLDKLNYQVDPGGNRAVPPPHRKALFLGDLCDRGPKNIPVLRLVMDLCERGSALCVPGNHDIKLLRYLRGSQVKLSQGLDRTVTEFEKAPLGFKEQVMRFIDGLASHYLLDQGKLVISHGGLTEKLQGRSSSQVLDFCLYGETAGDRIPWAEEYRGSGLVVYAHSPSLEVRNLNNTLSIDTGCVFGGKLTCFQYPEKQLVQVPAEKIYWNLHA